ncbi:MAG: AI-2E family transporter [Rhizobiaceae bacterium]
MAKARPDTEESLAEAAIGLAFRRQIRFWIVVSIVLGLFVYVFADILLPFVAGMVLAYFLDPVADRLERVGLSRVAATLVILIAFVVVLTVALIVLIPVLASQLGGLIGQFPEYLTRLQGLVTSFDPEWIERRFGLEAGSLREGLNSLLTTGMGFVTTVFTSIWSSGVALFSVAGLFIVTPVVAFYMLLDWDRMVATVDSWVPRDHVDTVRHIATDINASTAGFVRGQGTLCIVLGIMYAIGLTLTGLNFGILIGLFAGLISFIPYVGSLVGLVLAVGVAFVQFWPDWIMVAAVAGVFFVGQFIEGNILQPRLVGKSVGLHPVWLMFALFAFGALFGFVGLLIAVPAAAAVAVLVRFAIGRYLESPLYKGHPPDIAEMTVTTTTVRLIEDQPHEEASASALTDELPDAPKKARRASRKQAPRKSAPRKA